MNEKLGMTTILGAFGLAVSACYLMVYWGAFGIDIFQFAGLTDFVKLAIFPVAMAVLATGLALAFGALIMPMLPVYDGQGLFSHRPKTMRAVAGVSLFAAFAIMGFSDAAWRWGAALLLGVPFVRYVNSRPQMRRYIRSGVLRGYVLVLAFGLPLGACFFGAISAENIKEAVTTTVVDPTGIATGLIGTHDHPLVFVGFVSDTFVIYETQTGSVVLLKQVDNAPLVLKPNQNFARGLRRAWKVLTSSRDD
jgi:hypothetical protein